MIDTHESPVMTNLNVISAEVCSGHVFGLVRVALDVQCELNRAVAAEIYARTVPE